ncbi:hypothetical protein FMUAM8_09130 [Nocardia cyriacigeorgica]|nr:hypothetical protein FMUAM8_09130 [Nocardia cyriacigeorgica]
MRLESGAVSSPLGSVRPLCGLDSPGVAGSGRDESGGELSASCPSGSVLGRLGADSGSTREPGSAVVSGLGFVFCCVVGPVSATGVFAESVALFDGEVCSPRDGIGPSPLPESTGGEDSGET